MKRIGSLTRWSLCLLLASPCLVYGQDIGANEGKGAHPGSSSIFLPDHPSGDQGIPEADDSLDTRRPAPGQPIRILFLYTADAFAASRDPWEAVLDATSEINESFSRSGIDAYVEIAYVAKSNDRESGKLWQDLKSIKGAFDGNFDDAQVLRQRYNADVMMLITEKADGCGVAFRRASAETAYAVVQRTCMETNFTAAHELGHILGADHQNEITLNPYFPYGHGYQNTALGVRSIMAFPCPKWNCQRINVWSNPADGGWLGNDDVSNNRRVVADRFAIVAGFR